eukprot:4302188-Pyramimonas_sp.AAC.1
MTSILDAYHQCWMEFGPAKLLYSDGEGALTTTLRKQSSRKKALNLEYVRVDSTLQRSRSEMASYAIHFASWRLNSI